MSSQDKPEEVLNQFKIADRVYLLGTFETGLTIYSQQVRALNLVWLLVETVPKEQLRRIAIVGGGFAGLTAAAGLLHKGAEHISLFERRATLCPLQLGSDTRWVHPHIYDWPDEGSKLPTAALPLLNWNAGRASDVAVQVLQAWDDLAEKVKPSRIDVYLNVKHLRLDDTLHIEWVGEKSIGSTPITSGDKEKFDTVLLAVGFGLENKSSSSYWRNETLGQPELNLGKRTYLVSGHGDGALIDLFRIRISGFRQDRILVDLFRDNLGLVKKLRELKHAPGDGKNDSELLYGKFEEIAADQTLGFERLVSILRGRLRADTAAILQTKKSVGSFRKIFSTRASFQNRFLLYALYRAGGFIPIFKEDHSKICEEYGIKPADIIRRHGTDRWEAIEDVLDDALLNKSRARLEHLEKDGEQPNTILWNGGYWHQVSMKLSGGDVLDVDTKKGKWRVEHLPPATEVLVTGFVSAVAGYLDSLGTAGEDFRVTFHRTLFVGAEATLQQTTPYIGSPKRPGDPARTFGFTKGTIGYAATIRQVARTRPKAKDETDSAYAKALQDDMKVLDVETHSQPNPNVRSVLAVPILGRMASSVVGVLYADSTQYNVFTEECITVVNKMCQRFGSVLGGIHSDRVSNFPVITGKIPITPQFDAHRLRVIEAVQQQFGEVAATGDCLNLEFTDFVTLPDEET